MFWRPQVALLVSESTLLPVLMPMAPAATLLERVPSWLDATLRGTGSRKSTIGTGSDLIDLALELSEVPTSPLYERNRSPKHELAAVVARSR